MSITKKELARLARLARSFGYFGSYDGEPRTWAMVCPVHREALNAVGERSSAHHFPVYHLPWEDTPTVALVTKALASHLDDAEVNEQPCADLTRAPRS